MSKAPRIPPTIPPIAPLDKDDPYDRFEGWTGEFAGVVMDVAEVFCEGIWIEVVV